MSFQAASRDLVTTKQLHTLYLIGGNDVDDSCNFHHHADLRVRGGALIKKNLRVCENIFINGNINADSGFFENFISGNILLINTIMEKTP